MARIFKYFFIILFLTLITNGSLGLPHGWYDDTDFTPSSILTDFPDQQHMQRKFISTGNYGSNGDYVASRTDGKIIFPLDDSDSESSEILIPKDRQPSEQSVPRDHPPFKSSIPREHPSSVQTILRDRQSSEQITPRDRPPFEQSVPRDRPSFEQSIPRDRPSYEQSIPRDRPSFEQSIPRDRPSYEQSIPIDRPPFEQSIPRDPQSSESTISRDHQSKEHLIPRLKPTCENSTFCENTPNYPSEFVEAALRMNKELNFLSGVDLVPDVIHRVNAPPEDSSLCESNEKVVYPKVAQSKDKEWLFVINQGNFTQGVRVETCGKENSVCSLIDGFAEGYKTTCKQKYIYRQLVALSTDGQLQPEKFRFPASCCCHIKFMENPLFRMNANKKLPTSKLRRK